MARGKTYDPIADAGDGELVSRVRSGDPDATAELYQRHHDSALRAARQLTDPVTAEDLVAEAFTKVLGALKAGGGPTEAFRPYLLTAVRNTYVTHVRKDSRYLWIEDHADSPTELAGPDVAAQRTESALVSAAFASLPERWQAVLWHTAVEGEDHETVGRLLGIKANAVAALNFRARDGLRRAYLTAHLGDPPADQCRPTQDLLAPYVRRGLGRRQRDRVETHLDECARCSAAVLELGALNADLGAVLAPAVLGVLGVGYAAPHASGSVGGWAAIRWLRGHGATTVAAAGAAAGLVATLTLVVAFAGTGDPPGLPATGSTPSMRTDPTVRAAVDEPIRDAESTRPPGPTPSPPAPTAPGTGPTPHTSSAPSNQGSATPVAPGTATPPTTSSPSAQPSSTPATSPSAEPSSTPTTTPSTTPSTGPTQTHDLALTSGSITHYSGHDHVELVVVAPADPTVVTLEIADLISFSLHRDRDFATAECTAAGDSLTCVLPAGTGVLAIDVVVSGATHVVARISAADNDDPVSTNDLVELFG